MSKVVEFPQGKEMPVVIERDAAYCQMVLSDALRGLGDLCMPIRSTADEPLGNVDRSSLGALFTLLADYADAARKASPGR